MQAWGFYLPDLEWSADKLRTAAEALETVIASNPGASIDMGGELDRVARELRALVRLINEASRSHAKKTAR